MLFCSGTLSLGRRPGQGRGGSDATVQDGTAQVQEVDEPGASRCGTAVAVVMELSPLWVAPAVLVCGAFGYLSLLSLTFFSGALGDGSPLPARGVALVVGVPVVLLAAMLASGFLTSRAAAAWLAGRPSLSTLPAWLPGVVAVLVAPVAAVVPLALLVVLLCT